MALTIEYKTERSEIVRCYWIRWRKQLWKYHIVIFTVMTVVVAHQMIKQSELGLSASAVMKASGVGLACIIWMILYPILNHKTDLRTLSIDESGIKTSIGKLSAQIHWPQIASVDVLQDEIVITGKNMNAFIIPKRAFVNDEKRNEFVSTISRLMGN
jgi:hypothetical protein